MSEGNDAGGFNKSRSVLGDVTNRPVKRGISEREKSGVMSNDKDTVKHVRIELDLLKGDVLSRISKASKNTKGLNVHDLDSCAFYERSFDIQAELTCGHGTSEETNGDNAVKLCEKKAESLSVSPMFAVDIGSVNSLGDMSSSVIDVLTMRDKIGSRDCENPSFTDLEMSRDINFVDSKAGGSVPFGKFDSLKGEIPNAVTENTSSKLTGTVKSNVVDVARNSSADVASSVTKISKSSYPNLLDLGMGNAFRCANIKAKKKIRRHCFC